MRERATAFVRACALAGVLTLALALGACSEAAAPEERVRALVHEVELAAEARDVGDVLVHLSDEYSDSAGRTRAELGRQLRAWFALHPSLELLVRIEELEIESDDFARARVTVGMLAKRGAAEDWDAALDVRSFDLRLRRDGGDWRVISASVDRE